MIQSVILSCAKKVVVLGKKIYCVCFLLVAQMCSQCSTGGLLFEILDSVGSYFLKKYVP